MPPISGANPDLHGARLLQAGSLGLKGLLINVPVWGESYIDSWLRVSVPSWLSEGNLPAMCRIHDARLLVVTAGENVKRIAESPAVIELSHILPVEITTIARTTSELALHFKYDVMNACHNLAIAKAREEDRGLVFLLSDMFFANGALAEVARGAAAGNRAVLTQFVGVNEPRFLSLLKEEVSDINEGVMTVDPRRLVGVALRSLQAITLSEFWDANPFTLHPSIMYWRVGEQAALMRAWHLYPIFLYPERHAPVTTTIDGAYLMASIGSLRSCVHLEDSDRFFGVVLAEPGKRDFIPDWPYIADPKEVARWLVRNSNEFNREMIRGKFWIHSGANRADYRMFEVASDRVVEQILEIYRSMTQ